MKTAVKIKLFFFALLVLLFASGCAIIPGSAPNASPQLAKEIVFYNWINDVPQEVLDEFTAAYGVRVHYDSYESQEEAIDNMKAGQVFDVVVIDNQFLPGLIQEGMLRELDYTNLPNAENIDQSFRDFSIDPGRKHSIPYNWGTTGLVLRADKMESPVTSWNDLWNQERAGKVLMWRGLPRHMIGITLKSLGYSANSENPVEVERALEKLIALKENVVMIEDIDPELESSAPLLLEGQVVMAIGWNYDVLEAREQSPDVIYILPEEGALLWQDNFVIPANSPNSHTAEVFLNFLLQPEISAKITNFNRYPNAVEKSKEYVNPEILFDPIIYPLAENLKKAEVIRPLSTEAEALYADVWQRFLNTP